MARRREKAPARADGRSDIAARLVSEASPPGAVNRWVAGSSPARGVKIPKQIQEIKMAAPRRPLLAGGLGLPWGFKRPWGGRWHKANAPKDVSFQKRGRAGSGPRHFVDLGLRLPPGSSPLFSVFDLGGLRIDALEQS